MRRLALALVAATAALGGPVAAAMDDAMGPHVSIGYDAYGPAQIDVLAGDTVMWTNDSVRTHTVSAQDGSWSSATLVHGDTFSLRFDTTGAVPYYCMIHGFMRGEVDVHRVLLDAPREQGAPNRTFGLTGRAALPPGGTVAIDGDSGSGFQRVATATVDAAGAFHADVVPATTTTYRATVPGEDSPTVQLVVVDRALSATAVTHGRSVAVRATVAPASPGAVVVLQLRLREHFGWWPVARSALDARSSARFRVRLDRRVPARVVLTLADGATPLAVSRTLHVGSRR
jgi:plastocyanin